MRFLLLLLLSAFGLSAQTISYFNQGFLRQPSAQADMQYLGVLNLVQVTSNALWSGAVPSPAYVQKAGDTMTGRLTNRVGYVLLNTNTYISSGITSDSTNGQMVVFSDLTSGFKPTLTLRYKFAGNTQDVNFTYYTGEGARVNRQFCVGNDGDAYPIIFNPTTKNAYFGTNASIAGGIYYGDGSGLTNIPFGSLPSGILTNNYTAQIIQTNTSRANTYLALDGERTSSGNVIEYKTNNASVFNVTTTGAVAANAAITSGGGIAAASYLAVNAKAYLFAPISGAMCLMDGASTAPSTFCFAPVQTSVTMRLTTNWPSLHVESATNNPTLGIRRGTNVVDGDYASLVASNILAAGTVTATNGLIANTATATNKIVLPFAMLSSTNTLTAVAGTTNKVPWSNIELISRMSTAVGASGVTNIEPGKYMVAVSAIADSTTLPNKHMVLWARVNNVDVPRSATIVQIPNASTEMTLAVMFILNLAAGDYFEIVWGNDDNGVQILASTTLAGAPTIPYSPSIIMTVNKISD